jgi:hypothetical protein
MKKFIFAVFIFVACFALCGCKSHEVKEAEDQIDSIGEITTESGLAISEAEEAYAALSADEQKDVENYQILIDARDTYQSIALDSFQSAIEAGNYDEGNQIVSKLDNTTLKNIGYALIAYGADQAFGHWWYYENNDAYISDDAISKISGIIDCARNIENRMTISESDEFYPVVDFLQEFHDYMNDEIQYFDLSILHNKTSDLVYAMSDFVDALSSGSETKLYSSYNKIGAFANKLDYTGSNEFATQYVNSVYKLYSGATAIVSGIESGSSDLWNSGLEELQEGSAQETELTKLALANLEKTAVLLTKYDAVDDILKEWNPAS